MSHKNINPLPLYGDSLSLLTDLYQLTMAYSYWKAGIHERESVFYLFFRKRPFQGAMALFAGLETAMQFLDRFRFEKSDLDYLASLKGNDGKILFEKGFIDYLESFKFTLDIDAVPEGTAVFPYEPLLRVKGPILQAQLLESPMLNILNFQTLIATKASRVTYAAGDGSVVEFGLRRAQGIDGAMAAGRAAFIGGCDSSSNVLAGKTYHIPVKGTHAHSWIMAFDSEEEAFETYSKVMPNNCIFLIDTYDSVRGAKRAVEVAKKMRERGNEMLGVRLDSGDLAHLSIAIRKIFDEEGFPNAKIMASNELDEYLIRDLKQQGAKIDIWGVGTNLVTGKEQPALDGVYKLSAIKDEGGQWHYKLKISEQIVKVTNPGILQVRRFSKNGQYCADMIYDLYLKRKQPETIVDPLDPSHVMQVEGEGKDLLVPVMRDGKNVYSYPSLQEIQKKGKEEMNTFPKGTRRFYNPQFYLAGLEKTLYDLKLDLIREIE